jgi:hypothetical protein
MASSAITKVITQFDRLKTAAKNTKIKEHIREQNMFAMGGALAGAAIAGVVDAKYNADGSSTKTTIALAASGAILAVGGITDYVPGGLVIGMTGIGILCYIVGKKANDKMREHLATA